MRELINELDWDSAGLSVVVLLIGSVDVNPARGLDALEHTHQDVQGAGAAKRAVVLYGKVVAKHLRLTTPCASRTEIP